MTAEQWSSLLTPVAVLIVAILQRIQANGVKSALAISDGKSDMKLDAIHGLVNSKLLEQKRLAMVMAARIADLTKAPEDRIMAMDAQVAYEDTLARQRRVDSAVGLTEHRTVTSDGPILYMINERLDSIEGLAKGLACQSGPCPIKEVVERTNKGV